MRGLMTWAFVFGLLAGCVQEDDINLETQSSIDLMTAWTVHTIVAGDTTTHKGADGSHWLDYDGDGDLDVAIPWEKSNKVTLTLTGSGGGTVTLPNSGSIVAPEDVYIADVDGDTYKDLIIACDGGARLVIEFGSSTPLTATSWTRVDPSSSVGKRWLKVTFADMDGGGNDILAGGKEGSVAGSTGYFTSSTPRTASSWTYHEITKVGWTMSIYAMDIDGDSDLDVLLSDREKVTLPSIDYTYVGVRFYTSSGGSSPTFTKNTISSSGSHKFITPYDWDSDGDLDVLACRSSASYNESYIYLNDGGWSSFTSMSVTQPSSVGQCQDIKPVDADMDGTTDLAFTYTNCSSSQSGAVWIRNTGTPTSPTWSRGEISGTAGVKFDTMDWIDQDGDGDLDLTTTEQDEDTDSNPATPGPGLGGIFFENPNTAGGEPDAGCGS